MAVPQVPSAIILAPYVEKTFSRIRKVNGRVAKDVFVDNDPDLRGKFRENKALFLLMRRFGKSRNGLDDRVSRNGTLLSIEY